MREMNPSDEGPPSPSAAAPTSSTQPSGGRRRRTLILATALVELALVALGLEVVARVSYRLWFSKGHDRRMFDRLIEGVRGGGYFVTYKPHPYTAYTLREGTTLEDGEPIHTDDGFRAPAMPLKKRSGAFRIALLGGSTTYDVNLPFLKTCAAYLEEFLQRGFPDKEIEVLNAGVGGYTSAESFARFHFNVLDYDPDMVIMYHAINDVCPRLVSTSFRGDYRTARKIMKDMPVPNPGQRAVLRYCYLYRAYYLFLRLKREVPNLYALIYYQDPWHGPAPMEALRRTSTEPFERNIRDIIHICQGRGIEPVLATMTLNPTVRDDAAEHAFVEGVRQNNEVSRDLSRRFNVALCDLEKALPRDSKLFNANDLCHLNPQGNRLKAHFISATAIPILEKKLGAKAVPLPADAATLDADAVVHRYLDGTRTRITKEILNRTESTALKN